VVNQLAGGVNLLGLRLASSGRQFDHTAQRLRDARAEAARRAEIEAELGRA
jgi:hypothetical protein